MRFSDAEDGTVLLAAIGGRHVVHGMKAFYLIDGEDRTTHFVTLGPVVSIDGAFPMVYDSSVLRLLPVLDISAECRFHSSLAPEHLLPDLPAPTEKPGTAYLAEDTTLLEVMFQCDDGGKSRGAYLDVSSGELSMQTTRDNLIATSQWTLVSIDEGGRRESLFEFKPPEESII